MLNLLKGFPRPFGPNRGNHGYYVTCYGFPYMG